MRGMMHIKLTSIHCFWYQQPTRLSILSMSRVDMCYSTIRQSFSLMHIKM